MPPHVTHTAGSGSWEPFLVDGEQFGTVCRLPVHECPDGARAAGIRRIGTGDGRRYVADGTETMYVLEGEAELELADGHVLRLAPGDSVTMPAGVTVTWRTLSPVRAFFVRG